MNLSEWLDEVLENYNHWCMCGQIECINSGCYGKAKQSILSKFEELEIQARVEELELFTDFDLNAEYHEHSYCMEGGDCSQDSHWHRVGDRIDKLLNSKGGDK